MDKHLLSIDLWDTLILRRLNSQKLRLLVCRKIIDEFSLQISPEGLLKLQKDISQGLCTIASDLGFDPEYKLKNSWFFVGWSLMLDGKTLSNFADRSIEIEISMTMEFSKLNRKLYGLLRILETRFEISLISDFEGSSDFLSEILNQHGIGDRYKIFCSSDFLYQKSSGNLFRIYLEQFEDGVWLKKFHLGDNYESDFHKPKNFSIRSCLYPRIKIRLEFFRQIVRKLLSLRVQKLAYKSDVRLTGKLLANFNSEIYLKAQESNRVFYIGSEGAFLSQISWQELRNEQICLNFGRKQTLQALAYTEPKYVLSRLIAENCTLVQVSDFFEFRDKELLNEFFMKVVFSPAEIDFGYIRKSVKRKSASAKEAITRLNLCNGDLFVDIGYKGTFVRALTLLTGLNFNYLQIFGYSENCSDFSKSWTTMYLSDERGLLSYFRIDSRMIEILFSDGPRAPKRNQNIKNFILSPNQIKPGLISRVQLNRFFSSPSSRLQRILKSIVHLDDLKSYSPGEQKNES